MFTLTIETDNAAFEDDGADEIARILRVAAEKVVDNGDVPGEGRLRDINGNTVGSWSLT